MYFCFVFSCDVSFVHPSYLHYGINHCLRLGETKNTIKKRTEVGRIKSGGVLSHNREKQGVTYIPWHGCLFYKKRGGCLYPGVGA